MKSKLSKKQAHEAIDTFFQRATFTPDELRKIRRHAMHHRIRLGVYRKRFCRSCLAQLTGILRINNGYKTVICSSCGTANRYKL